MHTVWKYNSGMSFSAYKMCVVVVKGKCGQLKKKSTVSNRPTSSPILKAERLVFLQAVIIIMIKYKV